MQQRLALPRGWRLRASAAPAFRRYHHAGNLAWDRSLSRLPLSESGVIVLAVLPAATIYLRMPPLSITAPPSWQYQPFAGQQQYSLATRREENSMRCAKVLITRPYPKLTRGHEMTIPALIMSRHNADHVERQLCIAGANDRVK